MRKLYKSKKREDIDMVNAAIQNILSLLPKHLTAELQLARRTTMQVSGATPKCKPIEPSLKKRTTPKAEKREGRCLEVGKDAGGNAENVLSTMHTQSFIFIYFIGLFTEDYIEPREEDEKEIPGD
ncbi:unnamed protein product [Heligmosomoides polygyrus]|uniref:BHLH domain-containing protein n=1 Tax=Heligmosomoides polygyrus TaxID=6339 RepID=A0A183GWK3_HELPZ|nr:unnamed protein product [Heligmosomoides polygyrus]